VDEIKTKSFGSLIAATIDQAVDCPFIVFQYAYWTNCNYDSQTLVKLSKIKNFVAIKNAINDPRRYEEEYRCLKRVRSDISFLNANDVQLLSYFCIGSDGALVGYASLAPEFIVALYEAVEKGDLRKAREITNRMYPLTQAIYSHPRLNWHTRIKEALVMMGEIESAAARPFLPTISDQTREMEYVQDLIDAVVETENSKKANFPYCTILSLFDTDCSIFFQILTKSNFFKIPTY